MNIFYDNIIYFLQNSGGITRYWHELSMRFLADKDADIRFIEYPAECGNMVRRTFDIPSDRIITEGNTPLRLARYLPIRMKMPSAGIFHSGYYRDITDKKLKKIVTVHDFIYEYYSNGIRKLIHSLQKHHAVKNADGIICVSENTRKDLMRFYPETPEDKITVIHNGVSADFAPSAKSRDEILSQLGLEDARFTLFIGARGGYKNFETAVRASAMAGCFLLILGGSDLSQDETAMLEKYLGKRYWHFGFITNSVMSDVFSISHCMLYPSMYEGFGIPVLEAMKCGCPAVASNRSSLPEAAGDAGIMVDNITPEGFAEAISDLSDKNFRDNIIQKGFVHSSGFSWDRCFDETKAFYGKILSL